MRMDAKFWISVACLCLLGFVFQFRPVEGGVTMQNRGYSFYKYLQTRHYMQEFCKILPRNPRKMHYLARSWMILTRCLQGKQLAQLRRWYSFQLFPVVSSCFQLFPVVSVRSSLDELGKDEQICPKKDVSIKKEVKCPLKIIGFGNQL